MEKEIVKDRCFCLVQNQFNRNVLTDGGAGINSHFFPLELSGACNSRDGKIENFNFLFVAKICLQEALAGLASAI